MISHSAETAQSGIHFPSKETDTYQAGSFPIMFGEVIKESRKKKGLKQKDLADILKISRNTVSNWEADKSKPEFDIIPRLCDVLEITIENLFGFGRESGVTAREEKLLNTFRQLSHVGKNVALKMLSAMLDEECKAMDDNFLKSYLILAVEPGAAAAGPGFAYTDEYPVPVFIRKTDISAKANALVRVDGDSMEPVYHQGDYVYIRYTDSAHSGEDVVCTTANGLVIKRMNENGELYSVNPARPFGTKNEDDHIAVKGKVLGIVSPNDYAPDSEYAILSDLFHDQLKAFYKSHRMSETD